MKRFIGKDVREGFFMTGFLSIAPHVAEQAIQPRPWELGNSRTRVKVFAKPGVPGTPFEKRSHAADVPRDAGLAPSVALHIPWDKVDDEFTIESTNVPLYSATATSRVACPSTQSPRTIPAAREPRSSANAWAAIRKVGVYERQA